jgi:hypothetical protein
MIAAIALLANTVVQQPLPAGAAPDAFPQPADTAALSIVVAQTVDQTDPQSICPQAYCTSLFLATFKTVRTIAGPELPAEFAARMEMGSPYIARYTIAMIVERLPNGSLIVRASRGFHWQTHEACLDLVEAKAVGWVTSASGATRRGDEICVTED